MSKQNELYKIVKKGGIFTAKYGLYPNDHTLFSKEGINDLEQYGYALITTEKDGTHSLYLPTYKSSYCNYIDTSVAAIEAISGITEYQYFNNTLLLKKENYCVIIVPEDYIWYLGNPGIAEGRRNNLIKFYFSKTAFIKEEFGLLTNTIICSVDGTDYFIRTGNFDVTRVTSQIKVFQLGKLSPLPGNTDSFKVITENGEFIHQGYYYQDETPEIYASVVPFANSDYLLMSEILAVNKKSYGYWCKDTNGNIVRVLIFTENKHFATYNIIISEPVCSIHFLKRVPFSKDFHLDIWRVVCAKDQKEKYLLKCKEGTSLVNPEELI